MEINKRDKDCSNEILPQEAQVAKEHKESDQEVGIDQ